MRIRAIKAKKFAENVQMKHRVTHKYKIITAVQLNGKVRDMVKVSADADNDATEAAARIAPKVRPFIERKTIKKVIVVPKKPSNIVVG